MVISVKIKMNLGFKKTRKEINVEVLFAKREDWLEIGKIYISSSHHLKWDR